MKVPATVLVLLIAACLLGDLAVIVDVVHQKDSWPDLPGVFGLALAFGQTTLLAAWLAWGPGNVVLRSLLSAAGLLFLAMFAAICESNYASTGIWFGVVATILVAQLVPLVAARFLGYRIAVRPAKPLPRRIGSRQFSIWGLLSATTAVALALGIGRFVQFPFEFFWPLIRLLTVLTANGLIAFFCAWRFRSPWPTVAVLLVVCPVMGWLCAHSGLAPGDGVRWVILACAQGPFVALSVLALRMGGFRWVRPGMPDPVAAAEPAADSAPPDAASPVSFAFLEGADEPPVAGGADRFNERS